MELSPLCPEIQARECYSLRALVTYIGYPMSRWLPDLPGTEIPNQVNTHGFMGTRGLPSELGTSIRLVGALQLGNGAPDEQ